MACRIPFRSYYTKRALFSIHALMREMIKCVKVVQRLALALITMHMLFKDKL